MIVVFNLMLWATILTAGGIVWLLLWEAQQGADPETWKADHQTLADVRLCRAAGPDGYHPDQ